MDLCTIEVFTTDVDEGFASKVLWDICFVNTK